MLNTPLNSINSTSNKWKLVLITGGFAFLFTNIFQPFDIYSPQEKSSFDIFLELNIAIFSAISILAISHFQLKKILGITTFTYKSIMLWFLIESLLIGFTWMTMTYIIDGFSVSILEEWVNNTIEAIFLLALPYFSTLFYLNYKEKAAKIDQLLEEINSNKIAPDTDIIFKDFANKEKITLKLGNILYLEANDNYVEIFYLNQQKTERYLLRNAIKNLEKELIIFEIQRCHRSYMVNIMNIAQKKKTSKGLQLQLNNPESTLINVSKTYTSQFS